MVFTFRYEVDEYYEKKNNYEVSKQALENELKALEIQGVLPGNQAYLDKKRRLHNLEKQGLLSHVPEWPLLILGVLGIIATRMVNYFIDLVCFYFQKYIKE